MHIIIQCDKLCSCANVKCTYTIAAINCRHMQRPQLDTGDAVLLILVGAVLCHQGIKTSCSSRFSLGRLVRNENGKSKRTRSSANHCVHMDFTSSPTNRNP